MGAAVWQVEAEHLDRAVAVVARHARRTPLVRCPELGEGAWLKLENEQLTGSFKLRGALAALAALEPADRERGVLTASAGNHGFGLATAGARLGVRVTVFCAASTPQVKRDGIAGAGAKLELVDAPGYDEVERRAKEAARERGLTFVSPFDDPNVAAGNGGTLALEILEELPAVRTIVAPVGGGGLIAGLAAARRHGEARYELIGVQSEACPAMVESLKQGRALLAFEGAPTLAEGLEGGVSPSTYRVAKEELKAMALVSEDAIRDALRFAHERLGLAIEGSAAVGLAYARARGGALEPPWVVVITGGNVDPEKLRAIVEG